MSDVAAGAIGGLLTIGVAFFARASLVPREVAAHDRLAAERDDDLLQWVPDRDITLRRDLHAERGRLNARGTLQSGEYGYQLALLKEAALQQYRDQETQARRDVARIYDTEGALHAAWRTLRPRHRYALKAPLAVLPVLDAWRLDLNRGGTVAPINDPTARTLEQTIADIAAGTAVYE